jgi:ribosomal protein S14
MFAVMQLKLDKLNLILDENLTGVTSSKSLQPDKTRGKAFRRCQPRGDRHSHQSKPADIIDVPDNDAFGKHYKRCDYLVWQHHALANTTCR